MIPEEVLAAVPELATGVREVSVLEGGLTNVNHKVVTDHGDYVVRRWSDDTSLLAIDREHEHVNSRRAAEAGVGPPVVAYLPEHNTIVLVFLEGRTMSSADLRAPGRLLLAADACRRLHAGPPFAGDFDMFSLHARYEAIVRERGFRLPERFAGFAPQVAAIAEALAVRAGPTVPCHNDLLAENLILSGDRFRIIDFEYSGNNDPCFELGNLWSEAALDLAALEELVGAYHGRHLRHKVARARLWGVMSQHGWTLWASIQDGVSEIPFDFWAWGMEKHERAVAEFDDPGFEQLLAEARRAD